MWSRILFLGFLLSLGFAGFAQNTKELEPAKDQRPVYQPTKKNRTKKGLFGKKKGLVVGKDEAVKEYRGRQKRLGKEKKKEEKELEKPQYSNPLYFGHKKPPKKRPPGKQKYCKECQLRH